MTLLVSLALIAVIAAIVAAPLLTDLTEPGVRSLDPRRERLEREKSAALLAIREAEFDQATGKLSDEDYTQLRAFYEQRAIAALSALGSESEEERVVDTNR